MEIPAIENLIDNILDKKEELKRIEEELESDKQLLLEALETNNLTRYSGRDGKAYKISFIKDTLKKDDTLSAIDDINKKRIDFINMHDLINRSGVCFALVKENKERY